HPPRLADAGRGARTGTFAQAPERAGAAGRTACGQPGLGPACRAQRARRGQRGPAPAAAGDRARPAGRADPAGAATGALATCGHPAGSRTPRAGPAHPRHPRAAANRLGIWQLKWELEDLAFRHLEPDTYRSIARLLDGKRGDRERYIEQVKRELDKALLAHGLHAEVSGRPKHIYSIWKKMQKKGVPIGELYDLRAVRVMVDDVAACYAALGVVHALWAPLPSEFDDYIARPKHNDYRSLHTAVVGPE